MSEQTANTDMLLTVSRLRTLFPVRRGVFSRVQGFVRAVDGVDLSIRRGTTLGLVGESGSGKTTLGRTLLRLIPATDGKAVFSGLDVFSLTGGELRALRRRMQFIFQDPAGSLNPRMRVGDIVGEPLAVHAILPRRQRGRRIAELLERVGLPANCADRYPHEFSGGQRQRIGIARALAPGPEFIVADEPVSALDVSIQAQILNLLSDLQEEFGLSYLFIAHNLAVVEHFADEVAVMYLGRIVERAGREALYARAAHPYTQALLAAVPRPDCANRLPKARLGGEIPSPIHPPSGCPFHPRCHLTRKLAQDDQGNDTVNIMSEGQPCKVLRRCVTEAPTLRPCGDDPQHLHACLMQP
jgi:oligopeptide/dipeptide ABC transporter ATP-binding protein